MTLCPKCGAYMQVGTSGEYCPNGCGWNMRIQNYRVPVSPPLSVSDRTEPIKWSKKVLTHRCSCGKVLRITIEEGEE